MNHDSDTKRVQHPAFRRQSLSEILENEKNQRRVVPSSAPTPTTSKEKGSTRTQPTGQDQE